MLYVTRRATFCASHRLYNPGFSDEKNEEVFDKCNNLNGHGHNYALEVTVAGQPDPETGYVFDLKKLARIINDKIVDRVDHKHLNFDVDFLEGLNPTSENLAVVFWRILEPILPSGILHRIRIYESENNFVDYTGEPVQLVRFGERHAERVEV